MSGIGEAFAKGALIKTILDVTNGVAYIQNADTNSYIEGTFTRIKPPILTATPDNLTNVLSCAQAGATIQLSAGKYGRLDLIGGNAYPEGLTIVGGEGVTVAGVSISSGLIDPVHITDSNDQLQMPSNLTFKDLTLTDSICLRNCAMDGLNILNCDFQKGASIQLSPVSLVDKYGRDTTKTAKTVWHWPSVKPHIRNVIIDGNLVRDATVDASDTGTTAILVSSVNNIQITNNEIKNAPFNGIQVNGQSGSFSTGRIGIMNNMVRSSGSRSIRVAALKNAELFMHSNDLRYANQIETENEEYIKVSGCENTEYTWSLSSTSGSNSYRDDSGLRKISIGDGITLSDSSNMVAWVAEKSYNDGWHYRKWNDGVTELIGTVSGEIGEGTRVVEFISLPVIIPAAAKVHVQITTTGNYPPALTNYPAVSHYSLSDMEGSGGFDTLDVYFNFAPANETVNVSINLHLVYKEE